MNGLQGPHSGGPVNKPGPGTLLVVLHTKNMRMSRFIGKHKDTEVGIKTEGDVTADELKEFINNFRVLGLKGIEPWEPEKDAS